MKLQVSNFGLLMGSLAIVMPAHSVDYLKDTEAQKILFPGVDAFLKIPVSLSQDQLAKIKELSGTRQRNASPLVWKAQKNGKIEGYFFVDEVVGKHEFITYATAIDLSGSVIGIEIMSYRETHGGQVREASWRKNFKGKKISDPFKLDVDVPNITGATLSSRNVLDGVKRLLALKQVLDHG